VHFRGDPHTSLNSGSPVESSSLIESRGAGGGMGKATARAHKAERIRTLSSMAPSAGEGRRQQVGRQKAGAADFLSHHAISAFPQAPAMMPSSMR
jgi:hypothetical protein